MVGVNPTMLTPTLAAPRAALSLRDGKLLPGG
jgi:hypothetical protein